MAGPLNRLAPGLLDFLRLRSGGRHPSQLIETIQPTFDMWAALEVSNPDLVTLNSTLVGWDFLTRIVPVLNAECFPISLGGVGLTPVTVPQNEVWYLTSASVQSYNVPGPDMLGQVGLGLAYPTASSFATLTNAGANVPVHDLTIPTFNVEDARSASSPGAPGIPELLATYEVLNGGPVWIPSGTTLVWIVRYMEDVANTPEVRGVVRVTRLRSA